MKKKILLISLSVVAVIILVAALIYINSNKTKKEGTIHLYITVCEESQTRTIIDKDVDFYENEMLIDVLKRYVKVTEGTGSNQGMIMGINDCIITDLSSNYYKLIVNCEWATTGAWNLSLNDNDSIRITYSSLDDWSTGC